MPEAKTFLKEELSQKVPQKIISHFIMTNIEKDETVLAVFGSVSFMGIYSSVLSTEDRLIYLNNSSLVPKTIVTVYSSISDVELISEGSGSYIFITKIDGERFKIDIKAPNEDIAKLFDFIKCYKSTGTSYINEKIVSDAKYANMIATLSGNANEKAVANNEKIAGHNERMAAIHEKYAVKAETRDKEYAEKFNKIHQNIDNTELKKSHTEYKLNYCSGLNENVESCASDVDVDVIEQLVTITILNTAPIKIPLHYIISSSIRTDEIAPPDDYKTKHLFFIDIKYTLNNSENVLTFSKFQNRDVIFGSILHLDLILNSIDVVTKNNQNLIDMRKRENQNLDRLASERVDLLSQRADQIDQMKSMFHGSSNTDINPQQTTVIQQPINPINTSGCPNNFDEIKKF